MEPKRIPWLLAIIAILLIVDIVAHFRPYQIAVSSNGVFGYRLNCYTGEIVEFNSSGIVGPLKEKP
jgi:hypothetical protein